MLSSPLPVTSYLLYNSSSGSATLVQGFHPNPHLSPPINCTIVVVDHKLQYRAFTPTPTCHHLSIVQQQQWITNFSTRLSPQPQPVTSYQLYNSSSGSQTLVQGCHHPHLSPPINCTIVVVDHKLQYKAFTPTCHLSIVQQCYWISNFSTRLSPPYLSPIINCTIVVVDHKHQYKAFTLTPTCHHHQLYSISSGSQTLVKAFTPNLSPPVNCTIVVMDQQLQYQTFTPTCHHLSIVQQQQWITNFSTRLSPSPVTTYQLCNSSSGSQTFVQGFHLPYLSPPIYCTIVVLDQQLQYKAFTPTPTCHPLSIVQQQQWISNFSTRLSPQPPPVTSYQLYNSSSGSQTLVQGCHHPHLSPPINCTIVVVDHKLQYKAVTTPTCHHLSIVQQQQWITNFSTRLSPPPPVTTYQLYNSSTGSQTLVQGCHHPHLSPPINCTIVVVDHKLQYKAFTSTPTCHHLSIVQQQKWITNFSTRLSPPPPLTTYQLYNSSSGSQTLVQGFHPLPLTSYQLYNSSSGSQTLVQGFHPPTATSYQLYNSTIGSETLVQGFHPSTCHHLSIVQQQQWITNFSTRLSPQPSPVTSYQLYNSSSGSQTLVQGFHPCLLPPINCTIVVVDHKLQYKVSPCPHLSPPINCTIVVVDHKLQYKAFIPRLSPPINCTIVVVDHKPQFKAVIQCMSAPIYCTIVVVDHKPQCKAVIQCMSPPIYCTIVVVDHKPQCKAVIQCISPPINRTIVVVDNKLYYKAFTPPPVTSYQLYNISSGSQTFVQGFHPPPATSYQLYNSTIGSATLVQGFHPPYLSPPINCTIVVVDQQLQYKTFTSACHHLSIVQQYYWISNLSTRLSSPLLVTSYLLYNSSSGSQTLVQGFHPNPHLSPPIYCTILVVDHKLQ